MRRAPTASMRWSQLARRNGVARTRTSIAELGSTWRFLSMRDPDEAAHALGKLFKYCGENNVLWGTDSIWYGSPQDQIQAFRTFQIAPELRDKYGYPEITPELRPKVFALNAPSPTTSPSTRSRSARMAMQSRSAGSRTPSNRIRAFAPTGRARGASS